MASAWLCDWFGRRLTGKLGWTASDAECEQTVNNFFSPDVPIFQTRKSTLGGMWAKGRRGERPFNAERTAAVISAADKLKFWDPAWRRGLAKACGESDHLTLLMLSLLSVDGSAEQVRERAEFEARQAALLAALSHLKAGTSKTFDRRLAAALAALEGWREFSSSLSGGSVDIQPDLLNSIQSGHDDPRRWTLHPSRTIKRLALLSFGQSLESVEKATAQAWALHYVAYNFSDSRLMMQKVITLKTGSRVSRESAAFEPDLAINF